VAGVLPPVLVPSVLNAELPGPALSPEAGSPAHHEMESLISAASGIVSSGLDMASGRDGRFWGIGTHASASQLKRYESALGQMQQALTKSGGPFLLGAQVTIADLVLMPFIERFDIIGRNFHGVDATEICGGAISSWLEAMQARPSCQRAAAAPQELLRAYKQHKSLDFFDYSTYGATALHPQNRR